MPDIIRNCISIAAPAEVVFAFVTDPGTARLRMPPEVFDRYASHARLQRGDERETMYAFLGLKWTEHRWVVRSEPESLKVIWHTDSRFNMREEWRVEPLEPGRCRLVLERQVHSLSLLERLLWSLFVSPLIDRAMDRRLKMTRQAIEGGWMPNGLRTA